MRYQQWRLLLLRSYHRSHIPYPSSCSHVISISARSFSFFIHLRSGIGALQQSEQLCPLPSSMTRSSGSLSKSMGRSFSSKPAIVEISYAVTIVVDIFSRLSEDKIKIKKEMERSGIMISQHLALEVLRRLKSYPTYPIVARSFFRWITEASPGALSSEIYNTMLLMLGGNGHVGEFWGLVDEMKKKGHGLSANVRDTVGRQFRIDGLKRDLVRLENIFSSDKICHTVCKIMMKEEWSDDVETRVKDLNVEFHSDLVKMIVESFDVEPEKLCCSFGGLMSLVSLSMMRKPIMLWLGS